MTEPFDLSGRAVIVTGGSRGIGRTIATRFLAAGADVMVCARTEPDDAVVDGDRQAEFVAADVRDPEAVAGVVAATVARFGRLDVLVNNAGGAPPADSATVSPRFNERVIALNLLAPITFAQAANRVMQEQPDGGTVINIASVSGTRANPGGVAYGAAKAGLLNATKTLAVELGPRVRVVALVVGQVLTEEGRQFYGDDSNVAAIASRIPLRRMGTPDDVADACLYLASPLAGWVSGAELEVHGGGEPPGYLNAGEEAGRPPGGSS